MQRGTAEDHLDYFKSLDNIIKSFRKFCADADKAVIINGDDKNSMQAAEGLDKSKIIIVLPNCSVRTPRSWLLSHTAAPPLFYLLDKQILNNCRHIHFIGIGGSGMYPLAQILHAKGCFLTGSDNNETETLRAVREMGIVVKYTANVNY